MTKAEVAEFLGVSKRAVERYVQEGKLNIHYKKGRTNRVAIFDETEVRALKAEREVIEQRTPSVKSSASSASYQKALTEIVERVAVRVARAILEEQGPERRQIVPIEAKLTLNLKEAANLSGLSIEFLTEAINSKKLKAAQGRSQGWNIKRADLDDFVKKLQ